MIEFCSESPDRLWGQAQIGLWEMDYAVAELQRAKRAGLKAATVWSAPPEGIPWLSDHYERFWSACEDLEMPVTMHINVGYGEATPETRARGGPLSAVTRMAYGHKVVAMQCLSELTLSGVFERHPRLKLVLAEFDCGWIPFFLEDLDRKFGRGAGKDLGLSQLPSEYISRQVFATFMQDGVAGFLLQQWGEENFLYSNDYPHAGGIWPYSDDTIELTLHRLSPEARRKVLAENVARVFGMPAPDPMPRQPAPNYSDEIWSRPWLKKAGQFSFDKKKMGLAI
jgi:predicted TIM-barrel fold metal-dependent hydrolase